MSQKFDQVILYFGLVMEPIQQPTVVNLSPFLDYKEQDGFLYKLNQLCVPARSTCLLLIKEAHSSSHGGHFGVQKIMLHPQRYFFWPSMWKEVEYYIQSCSNCSQNKPANMKLGLYQSLTVPYRAWISSSLFGAILDYH